MAKEGSIAIPTGRNVGKSLENYGVGLAGGIGFSLISQFMANMGLGGGLIPGAIAAGITGAVVPGEAGKIITTTLGFNLGMRGLGALGLGNIGGILGGLGGNAQVKATNGPQFQLI
jgi:hypothetical protein